MPTAVIFITMFIWATITVLVFFLAQRYKSERTTLIVGSFFLTVGGIAPLYLTSFLNEYISCQSIACNASKIQAQTIIGFFTISWASFGTSLLSSLISHK